MANRYANLVGSNKIKDEYTKINTGFDRVQEEMDAKPNASIAQVNDIPFGADETLVIEGGTGITVTTVPAEKTVRVVATGEATPGPHAIEHITGGADVIPDATTSSSGLMSAKDKQDIDTHLAALVTAPGGVHGLAIEYGTFLPILRGADVEGEHTYAFRGGEYYRIGRLVSFMLGLRLSSKDPTMSGIAQIHGLPFVRAGVANNFESTSTIYANINISAPFQHVGGLVIGQSSHINIVKMGHGTEMEGVSSSEITSSTEVRLAGKYLTN